MLMMKKIKIKQKLNSNPIGFKKFVVIIKYQFPLIQ